jgi:hypothetical protein
MSTRNSGPTPEISNEIFHPHASKKPFRFFFLLALAVCSSLAVCADQSVTLAWQPDIDPTTTGYMVYSGQASGNYSSRTNVGTNVTVTIAGLKAGLTNFFSVTAYNSAGIESPRSSEVSYLVPGAIRLTSIPKPGIPSPVTMQFSVAAGHWYQIQASTDLKNWTSVGQTATATANTWYSFQDSQSIAFTQRFYRLVSH